MNLARALELPYHFLVKILWHYIIGVKVHYLLELCKAFSKKDPKWPNAMSHYCKPFPYLLKTGGLVRFVLFINLRNNNYTHLSNYMPFVIQRQSNMTKYLPAY